jgi:hypothetical protein
LKSVLDELVRAEIEVPGTPPPVRTPTVASVLMKPGDKTDAGYTITKEAIESAACTCHFMDPGKLCQHCLEKMGAQP